MGPGPVAFTAGLPYSILNATAGRSVECNCWSSKGGVICDCSVRDGASDAASVAAQALCRRDEFHSFGVSIQCSIAKWS